MTETAIDAPVPPGLAGRIAPVTGAGRVIAAAPRTCGIGIPLGGPATPDGIAEAVPFPLSGRAPHVTMASLAVDGGAPLCA